jgi:two-component system cell cycle sensor histidine kinase/response regulator CckA
VVVFRPAIALTRMTQIVGIVSERTTEVVMPGMSGAELNNRVRAIRPGIKLLFMSGSPAILTLMTGFGAAIPCCCKKPFTRYSLLSQVRTTLDRTE